MAEYVGNEDRYADLNMTDPEAAAILRPKLQQDCNRNLDALLSHYDND